MTHNGVRPLRIGAVNYLNSKPLIEGLGGLLPAAELRLDYPSRLADDLRAGELDVALIPSIECLRERNYEVVSDACVATCGPVLSVKLYSRVAAGKIRTLALDEGSRTSQTLVRIILAERFGVEPELLPFPIGENAEQSPADAVLVIGDRGIHPLREKFRVVWDLGEQWYQWTGLPFVFALWAARSDNDLEDVEDALSRARDRGVESIDAIAQREASQIGMSVPAARDYLRHNLRFHLGSAERNGLRLFHELAVQNGLAPEGIDLVYRNCATAG